MRCDIEEKAASLVIEMQRYYGCTNIPLHRPVFKGNENKYLAECIEGNFVSSAGGFVDTFEQCFRDWIGVKFAVATNSGTSALHVSLLAAGVKPGTEVITQALTFVATANAIRPGAPQSRPAALNFQNRVRFRSMPNSPPFPPEP